MPVPVLVPPPILLFSDLLYLCVSPLELLLALLFDAMLVSGILYENLDASEPGVIDDADVLRVMRQRKN